MRSLQWYLHGIDHKSFKLFPLPWEVTGFEKNGNGLIFFKFYSKYKNVAFWQIIILPLVLTCQFWVLLYMGLRLNRSTSAKGWVQEYISTRDAWVEAMEPEALALEHPYILTLQGKWVRGRHAVQPAPGNPGTYSEGFHQKVSCWLGAGGFGGLALPSVFLIPWPDISIFPLSVAQQTPMCAFWLVLHIKKSLNSLHLSVNAVRN